MAACLLIQDKSKRAIYSIYSLKASFRASRFWRITAM